MEKRTFWLVVGSQTLYGQDVLDTVAARSQEIADELTKVLPYPVIYKVTAKSNSEIADTVREANYQKEGATPSAPPRWGLTACGISRSHGAIWPPSTTRRFPTTRSTWTL